MKTRLPTVVFGLAALACAALALYGALEVRLLLSVVALFAGVICAFAWAMTLAQRRGPPDQS